MAITRTVEETVIEVVETDEYGVLVTVAAGEVQLTTVEARQVAGELVAAADALDRALDVDLAERRRRTLATAAAWEQEP